VRDSVIEARRFAAAWSLDRTREQLRSAIDWKPLQHPIGTGQWEAALEREHMLAAISEGQAVSSRYLESNTPTGRPFKPAWERRASWEADQAFNEARRQAIGELPSRVQSMLWLRWDTAGDRRVCDDCDQMDGQIVPAREGFDKPAPRHGNCRCTETLLGPDEI